MQTWKDTIDRLRLKIAGMDPEWSDHNLHDPGITILEMLVWMQQNQLYHGEQISEEPVSYTHLDVYKRQGMRPARPPRYLQKGRSSP